MNTTPRKPTSRRTNAGRAATGGQRRHWRQRRPKRHSGPHLELRGNRWWIMGTYLRILLRESTFETEKGRAEVKLVARMDEIRRNADEAEGRINRTFEEAAVGYRDAQPRSEPTKLAVNKLIEFYGPSLLCKDFNQSGLRRAFLGCVGKEAKEATKKRQVLSPVRAILTWAAAEWRPSQDAIFPYSSRCGTATGGSAFSCRTRRN